MGALSIAHGDSRAPISSSVPIRSDVSYIPKSIPDIIPEDSRSHSQWTSSSARNEQSMHSNLYQVSGQRPAGTSRRPKGRLISGTNGHAEELDPSYKARRYDYEKFFRPGRVFSTLWTDAFAASTNDSEKDASTSVTYVILGERVHSKIRRFVVVRQAKDLKSCTCVSITTYMGQGVKKRGINLDEHGLIYSSGKAPRSEKGIKKQALKVRRKFIIVCPKHTIFFSLIFIAKELVLAYPFPPTPLTPKQCGTAYTNSLDSLPRRRGVDRSFSCQLWPDLYLGM